MKKILFILILLCVQKMLHAQTPRTPYVYSIKADSVKITNTCDTAELIIENHTQTVPGFLFNKGRGRTEFRRIAQLDDTSVVIGGDTIHLGRGSKNFANADLTFDGNHVHNGAFHSVDLTDFSKIGFKSNNTAGTQSAEMTMMPKQGYSLILANTANSDNLQTTTHTLSYREVYTEVNSTLPDLSNTGSIGMNENSFSVNINENHLDYYYNTGIHIGDFIDYDPRHLDIYNEQGFMHFYNKTSTNHRIDMDWKDSLKTYCGGPEGATVLDQTASEFRFGGGGVSTGGFLGFRLLNLPVSTNSADSMLVIGDDGHVKKKPQSSVTPALSIIAGGISDITAAVDAVTKLPNLASQAGHSVSLPPAANNAGKKIYIWNQNASTNVWTFSSSVTLPDGTTSNAIPNQSTIELLSDGNVWIKWK